MRKMDFLKRFLIAFSAITFLIPAMITGCTSAKPAGNEDISVNKAAQPQDFVNPEDSSPVNISIPMTLADPEKTLVDYFKSIGYSARLVSKDDNVERGNERGLVLAFDLGNGASFHATVFKCTGDDGNTWEIVDSSFTNPGGELLEALIEQKLEAIIAMQKSNESEHNKNAFKGNTLIEIESYGKPALDYILDKFAKGEGKGERGDLLAEACIRILGYSNNVPKGWKSGEEWYSQLKPLEIATLPPASKPEGKTLEELATLAALERYKPYNKNGVVLVVPHVFDKYEEGDMLTLWATVYEQEYLLYGRKLVESSAGIIPAAIKLRKNADGTFTLAEYIEAKDGAGFAPSIREFCKPKSGVADKILNHYGKESNLHDKMHESLIAYLEANNLTGIFLEDYDGERTPLT